MYSCHGQIKLVQTWTATFEDYRSEICSRECLLVSMSGSASQLCYVGMVLTQQASKHKVVHDMSGGIQFMMCKPLEWRSIHLIGCSCC